MSESAVTVPLNPGDLAVALAFVIQGFTVLYFALRKGRRR